MATPTFGANGSVSFAGFGGVLARTWNATISRASIDVTAFGNYSRNRIQGIVDITGSIAGAMDVASTSVSPVLWCSNTAAATMTLLVEGTTNSIQFPAVVENCALAVDVAAGADVTYNFALSSGTTTAASYAFSNIATVTWT